MTPEQVGLVGRTWVDLVPQTDALSNSFYRHLFADFPELRPMFPADLGELRAKFVAEIGVLVEAVHDLDRFLARTEELSTTHAAHGVRAAHYRASRQSLGAAIAEVLRPDPDVLGAWAAIHDLVAETMMSAATGSAA